MSFVYFNVNPTKKREGDCAIQALCKAFDLSWLEVYDELVLIGREKFLLPNSTKALTEFVNRRGVEKIPVKYNKTDGIRRYSVEDIRGGWEGTYVVLVANHVTCIKNHVLYDVWDCSKKKAYVIWKVQK
jgi:hypothetical protein